MRVACLRGVSFQLSAKSQWKKGVPALVEHLGTHPSMHTLLRTVSVDLFKHDSAADKAARGRQLAQALHNATSFSSSFLEASKALQAHLVTHSASFKAAQDLQEQQAAAAKAAKAEGAQDMAVDGEAKEEVKVTHERETDFKKGDIVFLDRPELAGGRVAAGEFLAPLHNKYGGKRLRMVDNVFADDQGYIMVQVSGPPATYHGEFHAYLDSGGVLETRSYCGAALRSEVEAGVALVGSLLLDWDAVDVAQYTAEDVKTGSEKRPAYLKLRRAYHYEDPHVTDFGDYVQGKLHDWNDDPDCAQALACCLWDSLPTPGCSTPATVFIRLCNLRPGKEMEDDGGEYEGLTCDWEVYLAAHGSSAHLATRPRHPHGSAAHPAFDNWLMRAGGHLPEPLRVLWDAERHAPPSTAAALLALGELNPAVRQAPSPPQLTVTLKPYQRIALGWMQDEESNEGMLRHSVHPLSLPTLEGATRERFYSPLTSQITSLPPARICGGWHSPWGWARKWL